MAKNITLMGASYSDVPAVTLPKTGGGTARFDDASVTTATASDVASGKVFLAANGQITTGTASGGGGASNVVTGTFTGTTTGAVLEVSTGYTGDGHPIRISIAPKDGAYNSSSTFYSTIQRYAICSFAGFACKPDGAVGYGSSPGDTMNTLCYYKSSSSSATSYTAYGKDSSYILNRNNPTADRMTPVRFPNKSTMKVYIADTSYGFMANIEYHYVIEYSS